MALPVWDFELIAKDIEKHSGSDNALSLISVTIQWLLWQLIPQ
jgi:hypothetical protein